MADITSELSTIENATYGVQVRTAIHDGLQKVNNNSTDSGWVNVDLASGVSLGSNGKFAVRKIGKIVFLEIIDVIAPSSTGAITLGTIPSGYRPDYTWAVAIGYPNASGKLYGYINIGTNGTIVAGVNTALPASIYTSTSYPIA